VKLPSMAVGTGGKFRYEEREVPDTFNILIDYPERVSIAILGTQGNDHPGAWERPPRRSPIIRGWNGTLTFEGKDIVYTPPDASGKPAKRFPVLEGFDHQRHMESFLSCCRTRRPPYCPVELAYHTQTALQMGVLAFREGKVARFNAAEERIEL